MNSGSQPFAGCLIPASEAEAQHRLALVGFPDDRQSSYRAGCRFAPQRIREAYDGLAYNASSESGIDLTGRVADYGDVRPGKTREQTHAQYRKVIEQILQQGRIPFVLGGDHAVTIPVVAALQRLDRPIHVLQFDAHPDLYPEFQKDPFSHACVARRLLDFEHVAGVTQIGIRTMNTVQAEEAGKFGDRLHIITAEEAWAAIPPLSHLPNDAHVYITFDVDVLDPAFAPGVSHPVPGGLATRPLLSFLSSLPYPVVGMDVVEVNPQRDVHDLTAVVAARLLHEGMATAWKQSNAQ